MATQKTKSPPKGIQTATSSAETAEKEEQTEQQPDLKIPKFDVQKRKKIKSLSKKPTSNRPRNIYIEADDGDLWLWYNTEQGHEVGIERTYEENPSTMITTETEQIFSIPATKHNIELLKKETFTMSQWIFKDGVRRTVIPDLDKFIQENKL